MTPLAAAALRRHVVAAQGYATRPRRGTAADVEAVVERLGCVQLDSISAVARSHRLALLSRAIRVPARICANKSRFSSTERLRQGLSFPGTVGAPRYSINSSGVRSQT